MKKFIMAVFLVFMIFGCADDKNQSLQNPSDNNTSNQDEYFEAIINTISNIPVSDNISQWGFIPYYEDDFLDVFLADKLGRPNKNTNKIVYIYTSSGQYTKFKIYENKYADHILLHQMDFYVPYYDFRDIKHYVIDYYTKFIKTEPYKNIYEETIYIKKN